MAIDDGVADPQQTWGRVVLEVGGERLHLGDLEVSQVQFHQSRVLLLADSPQVLPHAARAGQRVLFLFVVFPAPAGLGKDGRQTGEGRAETLGACAVDEEI